METHARGLLPRGRFGFAPKDAIGFTARLSNIMTCNRLLACLANRRGAIGVFAAVTLPVLIGAMGLGVEVSYWYLHQRAMQNAADAAAIAAGTNGGATYASEAKAVATQYGFHDATGNVTVSVANPANATGCASNCYTVTVSDSVPIFLAQLVGYVGNVTVNGKGETKLTASAVTQSNPAYPYCVLALGSSGAEGITSNGAPNANLQNCNTMSNTTATCHGHNLNATYGDAVGTNSGCGITQHSNVSPVADPYAGLASNIPANTCGSYPQEDKHGNGLPASNKWSGTESLSGNVIVCGDLQLTGNTTVSAPSGAVLIIENGQLDTAGNTLQTASGSSLTIVFTGTNSSTYTYSPTGGGTLDITPPSSGPWSGVAIYQDPSLTTGVDISYSGNSPTWNIGGLVYLPHASVTFSGAVGKNASGTQCFVLVVDNMTINGTGNIFANDTGCAAAGLSAPTGGHRGTLVN